MAACTENIRYINGKPFIDVTGMTIFGTVYTLEEAIALTEGRCIARSQEKPPQKDNTSRDIEHFWKQLPKFKKRKYMKNT